MDKLEQWPIDKLIGYANNPRKNDQAVDKIAEAINAFGFRVPILAKSDGTVIDGHLRLKAAKKLNLINVPVIPSDDMSEADIKGFRISVNSTMIDDVEVLMDGNKADMVFTDPPYNIDFKPQRGTHEKILNDSMSDNEFSAFLDYTFSNCLAILSPDTYVVSFSDYSTIPQFKKSLESFFSFKSLCIWKKNNFGIGYYARPQYEPFFLCLNGNPIKPENPPSDVFEYAKVYKTIHSCEKPVGLIEIICGHFNRNGLIYDPFGGSGSTLIACEKTNRNCYMMELDEKYCDVIIKRWMDFTGKIAILESSGQEFKEVA